MVEEEEEAVEEPSDPLSSPPTQLPSSLSSALSFLSTMSKTSGLSLLLAMSDDDDDDDFACDEFLVCVATVATVVSPFFSSVEIDALILGFLVPIQASYNTKITNVTIMP